MRSTSRERALAWIGPIIHWGAPEILRTRVAFWRQSILWVWRFTNGYQDAAASARWS